MPGDLTYAWFMTRRPSASGADASSTTVRNAPPAERGQLRLVVLRSEGTQAYRIPATRVITVGRASECDVAIEGASSLSRRHFALREGPPHTLNDLGSANGTKLNGKSVPPDQAVPVEIGSLIEAGGFFFILDDRSAFPSALPRPVAPPPGPGGAIVVEDPATIRLYALIDMVARSTIPVLVIGETGAGKEVVSEAIHQRSPRAQKPLVRLNCAALTETLLESELFGYERGAFTGATQAKQGLIEAAHEGTLFLDEVGELPPATQAKLLRVVENGELLRVGALKPRPIDVRFIAATNRDLPSLVASGGFRRDLFYRLNGITIPVPPLRERPVEILPLARTCLTQAAARAGRRPPAILGEAEALLLAHSWPGNVRELRHVMERALAICEGEEISAKHVRLDPPLPGPGAASSLGPEGEGKGRLLRLDPATEKQMILRALEEAGGNQTQASRLLGVSRRTLVNRLSEYGMTRAHKRSRP